MTEAEFFDCTPVWFMRRRRAWLENRPGMEAARFVSFWAMRAAGAKVKRLTQICRFSWDKTIRTVNLEPWDSPAMQKFDQEADEALRILNPKAWEQYMEGKAARVQILESAPDEDMRIDAEIDL